VQPGYARLVNHPSWGDVGFVTCRGLAKGGVQLEVLHAEAQISEVIVGDLGPRGLALYQNCA